MRPEHSRRLMPRLAPTLPPYGTETGGKRRDGVEEAVAETLTGRAVAGRGETGRDRGR